MNQYRNMFEQDINQTNQTNKFYNLSNQMYQQSYDDFESELSEEEYDEDDIDYSKLTDDNPDFLDFKDHVREWLALDDDIATLQKALKERRQRKNDLTPMVLEFMSNTRLTDINTKDGGKIRFAKSVRTQPINKKYLITRLGDYFKNIDKAEQATNYLFENREKTESFRIKRIKARAPKDLF